MTLDGRLVCLNGKRSKVMKNEHPLGSGTILIAKLHEFTNF